MCTAARQQGFLDAEVIFFSFLLIHSMTGLNNQFVDFLIFKRDKIEFFSAPVLMNARCRKDPALGQSSSPGSRLQSFFVDELVDKGCPFYCPDFHTDPHVAKPFLDKFSCSYPYIIPLIDKDRKFKGLPVLNESILLFLKSCISQKESAFSLLCS